ncbi:hypothetical protein [Aneurinibacillus aneurinilyticus]|jgi:hypothetical protein|uniref:Uncharacterized protein n=2 Tax=Aneurinibacillus aneurinilyticus TaxID=1391 RepID=A0A848CK03_ANEAE|nr:hypothetical protein [Aneurinibacillus aneurinilyticus]ERI08504.1 hypothetical protein HMPREF0083_03403 [Aneurinibacillus aneurinilyticus ATCC 12856]MCI1693638.1 hypothetical protein [Aneurinibacillus aneurinilyticus]MED0669007.1 hypothetical protein [Aneurinibacillus aneurinilyticus]MED0708711.1 hypothetical protein [Aneurinibacillus aneurinilyticus]MED0724329.1 hypothetical protein [Aneurinibacillus aneurinilyticus]
MEAGLYLKQDSSGQLYVDFDAPPGLAPSEFVEQIFQSVDVGYRILGIHMPNETSNGDWEAFLIRDGHSVRHLVCYPGTDCIHVEMAMETFDFFVRRLGYEKIR